MAPVSSIMHRFRYQILHYLDDWLVLGSSLQEITWARDFLLVLCLELGVQVNLSKSSLTPSQKLDYLGMTAIFTFEGFPNTGSCAESSLSRRRVLLLTQAATQFLVVSVRCNVIPVEAHSLLLSADARSATPPSCVGPSVLGDRADLLGRLLPRGSLVVVCSLPSRGRSRPRSPSARAHAVY